jgi:hypothetical protein
VVVARITSGFAGAGAAVVAAGTSVVAAGCAPQAEVSKLKRTIITSKEKTDFFISSSCSFPALK